MITILNVYSPHTQKVKNDSKELDELYYDINTTITSIKNCSDRKSDIILIGGDFNAKVGKSFNSDSIQDLCLGKHSKGGRNESGQSLVDCCNMHNWFVRNTTFQHLSRHITTWEQHRTNKTKKKVTHTYNQNDYIICRLEQKRTLISARSCAGTAVNSDHR